MKNSLNLFPRVAAAITGAAFLLLAACSGPAGGGPGKTGPAPEIEALVPRSELRKSSDASEAGGTCYALVIAADRHRVDSPEVDPKKRRAWDIPFAKKSADLLAARLESGAGFPRDRIRILSGPEVTASNIKSHLLDNLALSINGTGNLLFVYYAGHGMADDRNRAQLFLWDTDVSGSQRFSDTLAYADLQSWVGRVKSEVEKRGGDIGTVVLTDACKVRAGAPPTNMVMEATADVVIHSCRIGEVAHAHSEGFIFSRTFTEALESLGDRGRILVEDVFQSAKKTTSDATNEAQIPEIRVNRPGVALYSRSRIKVETVVVDGHLRAKGAYREVAGAEVLFNGRKRKGGLIPTNYTLTTRATGYMTLETEHRIGRSDSGSRIEIPLYPEFLLVTCRFLDELGQPAAGVTAEVTGLEGIADYHILRAAAGPDGLVYLKLPSCAGEQTLVVSSPRGTIARKRFRPENAQYLSSNGLMVPVVEIADVFLTGAEAAVTGADVRIAYEAPAFEGVPIDVDTEVLFPGSLSFKGIYDNTYGNARRYFREGRPKRALDQVAGILDNEGYADAGCREALVKLAQALRFSHCAKTARGEGGDALQEIERYAGGLTGDYAEAVLRLEANLAFSEWNRSRQTSFDGSTHLFEERIEGSGLQAAQSHFRPLIQSSLLERASSTLADGDWEGSLRYLLWTGRYKDTSSEQAAIWKEQARARFEEEQFAAAEEALLKAAELEADPSLESQRRTILLHRMEKEYDRAFENGEWALCRTTVDRAACLFSGDDQIDAWRKRIEREAIGPTTRALVVAANKAFARGGKEGFEEAERLYGEARPGCNDHYRNIVDTRLADLADRLFRFYDNLAVEADLSGDRLGFFAARLRCADYYPDAVRSDILDAWETPEVRKEYTEEDLVRAFDREDPRLEWTFPADGEATVQEALCTLRGRVRDDYAVDSLTVNGRQISLAGREREKKTFTVEVTLSEGKNRFEAIARDRAGNVERTTAVVTFINAPVLAGFTLLREESFSCGGETNLVRIYRHERTGLEFVLVPGGSFEMGSNSGNSQEKPVHTVTVKPFLVCRTECTQAAWDRIGGDDDRTWRGADLPIENVSWNDATAWCRKAGLRLPTEAEWEYACRAGTDSPFCFGDSESGLGGYCWYNGNSGDKTHPVGGKKANAFGLFDMHGNVWEWCQDKWHDNYSDAPSDGSSWDSGGSSYRIHRGGCWPFNADACRSADRFWYVPGFQRNDLGFRPFSSLP